MRCEEANSAAGPDQMSECIEPTFRASPNAERLPGPSVPGCSSSSRALLFTRWTNSACACYRSSRYSLFLAFEQHFDGAILQRPFLGGLKEQLIVQPVVA